MSRTLAIDRSLIHTSGLTGGPATVVMTHVASTEDNQAAQPVSAALCVDRQAFDRFGRALRHLLVGLIDQAVRLRLVSSDPRIEKLTLGPVQTVRHERIGWPVRGRRIGRLVEVLSHPPPTVVHAFSDASYGVGLAIAEALDADIVLQVTSVADCDAIARLSTARIGRFLALSQPLAAVLEEQLKIPAERIYLIRPGVRTSQRIACFAETQRAPTVLCLSSLERRGGVDKVIEAVDLLRKRGRELLLFLLGRGRWENALRYMVRERRLKSNVTFAQPSGDSSQAMNSADIFICPAVESAFPGDTLQAMGAGMAVVTLPNAVCDFLRDAETAIVCEKPTAQSISEALERLITDRAEARRIAAAGTEYVRSNHSVSAMAERTANAYRELALARATFSIKEQ